MCGTALRRTCAVCHTDPLQNFLSSFTTTTFLTSHFFFIQRYPCVLARLSRVKKMLLAYFLSSAMSFCHRILDLAEPGSPFCLVYINIQSAFLVSIITKHSWFSGKIRASHSKKWSGNTPGACSGPGFDSRRVHHVFAILPNHFLCFLTRAVFWLTRGSNDL